MNDLVSVLALPSIWSNSEPNHILETFLDAVLTMLDLDFVYSRVQIEADGEPAEKLKISSRFAATTYSDELRSVLGPLFEEDPQRMALEIRRDVGGHETSILSVRLGIESEIGNVFSGSHRADFPTQAERLLLGVAANQVAVQLQQTRLLSEQKRLASELGHRVAERTANLEATNAELRKEIEDRRVVEDRLLRSEDLLKKSETRLRQVIDTIPALTWSALPEGQSEFLSQSWHEFTGLSPEEAAGWGWGSAIHAEDLSPLMEKRRTIFNSGEAGEIEARLRRRDGAYRWFLLRLAPLRDERGRIIRWYGAGTDIDDRKVAEETLRSDEAKLRQIVNRIPGLVCTMNAAGEVEQLNQPLLEYFGKTLNELKGWKVIDAVHPDDLPLVIDAFAYSVRTGTFYEVEHRCRRADGVYRWFQVRASAVRDAEDKVCGWYVLLTDIEDRKLAENALRSNERNLIQIINTIPTTAWSTRPDGYCDFLSDRWLNYAGFSFEEAVGWNWASAIHPDDADGLREYWLSCLGSGTPVDTEARIRRFDGAYRWFLFRANPFRDESGKITKWYGTNVDIEDRKRAENAVRANERDLIRIINTMPMLAWSTLPDGSVDFLNQRWLDFTGLSAEQAAGWGWSVAVHPDDGNALVEYWQGALATGHGVDVEARLRRFDGEYRWFLFRADPLRDESGAIVKWYGTNTDIDQRRRAEEGLRNAQAELARMMRVMTIGQLTASIAHEVSQPLSGIITNANTCLRMLNSEPPNVNGARETAQRTIRDGKRATDVITRLRTLFSKKKINIESVDLNEATREVIALLGDELQPNRVIVQHQFDESLPMVQGDRVQLQQVLLNLLRNASEAMNGVGDRPRRIYIRTSADGNHATVHVQDSGVGVDPENSERLFEAFFTTKQEGMGMGLSLSRSIVEAHGGRLWATSNDDAGATFSFSIPCGPEA